MLPMAFQNQSIVDLQGRLKISYLHHFSHSCISKIEDGALIDASEMAKELGIELPVAITSSVWTEYIQWTKHDGNEAVSQEAKDRLRDILRMLAVWLKYHKVAQTNFLHQELLYEIFAIRCDSIKMELITLKAIFSKGDNLEPVITIMLENEN